MLESVLDTWRRPKISVSSLATHPGSGKMKPASGLANGRDIAGFVHAFVP